MKNKSKKIIASLMALSIVTTGVILPETDIIKDVFQTKIISAYAANTYGDWEYEEINNYSVKLVKYKGNSSSISIPESINKKTVIALGDGLFKDNKNITSVTIPRGIAEIPKNCFYNASKLKSVIIPEGITKIEQSAFEGTISLKTINLSLSLNRICSRAFAESGLTSISIPSVKVIERDVFYNCKNLSNLVLPNNTEQILNYAFCNATSLTSIAIPSSVERLGTNLFNNCTSLENVDIPNAQTFEKLIKNHSFVGCNKISKINNNAIINYQKVRNYQCYRPIINEEFKQYIIDEFLLLDHERIAFFEEYIKAYINYVAITKTANCKNDGEKIKALHDWVCNKVEYSMKDGKEDIRIECKRDSSVFMRDFVVCEGYARALTLLLNEAGIEAYKLSSVSHAWVMVKLGNYYFHVDPTFDDSSKGYDYFLKSDSDIKKSSNYHLKWEIEIPDASRISYDIPEVTPKCPYSVGDVNMDGKIDNKDADAISFYIMGAAELPGSDNVLADINLDGKVDMKDLSQLKQQYNLD